ncbi:hypothetical protein FJO98_01615 [Enterococcus sp. PF-2]|uniref:hypothetical protein n=1 Tax=unclassified Enterococcus TaxID=2608891 RepID=UPI00111CF1C2|nr:MULTISPECIES: hypothetical protein [unclassified Enterococcus]TPE08391.1 hypothetical protein FJP08_01615 [Enterococcus sp. PF-3]TPE29482.1 hypothetical protein FJO98_01615 [Enterococcus sp. PF-2]
MGKELKNAKIKMIYEIKSVYSTIDTIKATIYMNQNMIEGFTMSNEEFIHQTNINIQEVQARLNDLLIELQNL